MPCTPALFSLPVEQAQVQVVGGGRREGEGTSSSRNSSSSDSSSSSNTVAQSKVVGTTLAQIYLERGDRFLLGRGRGSFNGLGTYRPTVRGYAAGAPGAGGKFDGLGSPTESSNTGTEGGMLQMPPAGSLCSGVPDFPGTYERGGPVYSSTILPPHALRWWLGIRVTPRQWWTHLNRSFPTPALIE